MPANNPLIMTDGPFPGYYWWRTIIHSGLWSLVVFSFEPGHLLNNDSCHLRKSEGELLKKKGTAPEHPVWTLPCPHPEEHGHSAF